MSLRPEILVLFSEPHRLMNDFELRLRRLDRRDWWQWSGAILVTLLLTGALFSSTLPYVLGIHDADFEFNLRHNVQLLIGLVLLFDIYTIYYQLQMARLRRELAREISANIALEKRGDELKTLAVLDPLTGLYNRRLAEERLKEEVGRAQRHHQPLTVMLIDLDEFKHINDTFGHAAGDRVLKECAVHLKNATRVSDVTARLGGDEFVILLIDCSEAQASKVLTHLGPFEVDFMGNKIPVAFSIGYADCQQGDSPVGLLDRADKRLYDVKRSRKATPPDLAFHN